MSLTRFQSPLVTVHATDTVQTAARLMREHRVGCVVILHDGRPFGVVTDRDIVLRVVAEGRDPARTHASDVATYDPITVSIHDGVETVVDRMRRHGIRRLPIVGDDGAAVGIVTADDLLVMLGGELAAVCEGIDNRADAGDSR